MYCGVCWTMSHPGDTRASFPRSERITGPGYQREQSPPSAYKARYSRDRMDGHSKYPVDRERGLRPFRLRYSTHGPMQKQVMATIASTIPIVSVAKALTADTMCPVPTPPKVGSRQKATPRSHSRSIGNMCSSACRSSTLQPVHIQLL
jgi:hypothetical protein